MGRSTDAVLCYGRVIYNPHADNAIDGWTTLEGAPTGPAWQAAWQTAPYINEALDLALRGLTGDVGYAQAGYDCQGPIILTTHYISSDGMEHIPAETLAYLHRQTNIDTWNRQLAEACNHLGITPITSSTWILTHHTI